jgi:beta-lactamase superfamily II metal-dependent hydrolase
VTGWQIYTARVTGSGKFASETPRGGNTSDLGERKRGVRVAAYAFVVRQHNGSRVRASVAFTEFACDHKSDARWERYVAFEVDFIPVGKAGRHGDAIAMRFTRPDTGGWAHVIIDAGFDDNAPALISHIRKYYETNAIDTAIVTHPDGDHIGGMGAVIRELDVGTLAIHRLGQRGGAGLPAAEAVDELIQLAQARGTAIVEPFAGVGGFGGALRILGPTEDWYAALVAEQQAEAGARAAANPPPPQGLLASALLLGQRFVAGLPFEIPFDDASGTNPRNNSSTITLLEVDGETMLFQADAGVPALDRAWDWLRDNDGDLRPPDFVQIAHHGSRHNASSDLLDRILGPHVDVRTKEAFVNVGSGAKKHPSPRVANGYMRRGYNVHETRGQSKCHRSPDMPMRPGWTTATPLEPLDESEED